MGLERVESRAKTTIHPRGDDDIAGPHDFEESLARRPFAERHAA